MRRFFIDEIRSDGGPIELKGQEARHITRVLRMGPGDRFVLFDGKGTRYQAVIDSAGRKEVVVFLEKTLPAPPEPPVDITLCQALLRGSAMDDVVRKTSELGAVCIMPLLSERTLVRYRGDQWAAKHKRLQEIAKSAAKQAGRSRPAEIGLLYSFEELLELYRAKEGLKTMLWEGENARDLKGLLRASATVKTVIGLVGPEGGFTDDEVERARSGGFTSVSLGQRILRADTAAMTMVALLQYELGDLNL